MPIHALLVAPELPERTYPGKAMGLDSLAASLHRCGCRVTYVDVDVQGRSVFLDLISRLQFDLICFTSMSIQIDEVTSLAWLARELQPSTVLLRGGPHDTHAYRESCRTHMNLYDAYVVGEGEETISEIVEALRRGDFADSRPTIKGLAYWDGEERFSGPRRPSTGAWPIPLRLYHHPSYNFDVFGYRKTAQVLATRGCSNSCLFCSESVGVHGRVEHRRPVSHLAKELLLLKREGYQAVYFDDPTFTRDRQWVLDLAEVLAGVGLTWGCNTRVENLDAELVASMRRSGCSYLFCGVESGSPEVLRGLNKAVDSGIYLESALRAYAALRGSNLPCSAFLIFGGPRMELVDNKWTVAPEADCDVDTSLDFAIRQLDPDYLSMNILRLLPGVPLSFGKKYACIRPTGEEPVHGGYYDSTWYRSNSANDLRARHPILRAFEGCGSVNPPQMTPERCYDILHRAVDTVNLKNSSPGTASTKIVVDPRFGPFLREVKPSPYRRYELATFEEIDLSAEADLSRDSSRPTSLPSESLGPNFESLAFRPWLPSAL